MNKKIVSLAMTALLVAATAMPVFAASPATSTVETTPVTVSAAELTAKGYADVTPAELQATATTLQQALALATTSVEDPIANVVEGAVAPNEIAMAKLDILKNPAIKNAVANNGGLGVIVTSKALASTNGKSSRKTVRSTIAGTVPGDKVTIVWYRPGDPTPHYKTATVRANGKINFSLPIPSNYHVVR